VSSIEVTPIGVVRSRFIAPGATPVQSALSPADEAVVEIDPRYTDALDGLTEFSHVWLLCWLDRIERDDDPPLRQVPFLLRRTPRPIGVLATRGPRRINPLGLSLVRLISVEGATLRFAGVDVLDGTPVVDVKPYVARFDAPAGEVRCGWFDTIDIADGSTPDSLTPGTDRSPSP
jgi:tRNA-Thr(GGU) m(6)t(6)A37 methyltransferase TsaA